MNARLLLLAAAIAGLASPLDGQASRLRVIHNFGSGQDGNVPSGPLTFDSAGNLYGSTGGLGPLRSATCGKYWACEGVMYAELEATGDGSSESISGRNHETNKRSTRCKYL